MSGQHRLAPAHRFIRPGAGAALLDSLAVGLAVFEAQDVLCRDPQVFFLEGAGLDQHRDPFRGA